MMTRSDKQDSARIFLLTLAITTAFCGIALAYTYSALDESRSDYSAGASRKLGRGLANTGLGWTEILRGIDDVEAESGFWAGATWGPLYGAVNAVKRTGVGIYETVTFPFAGPNRFDPVIKPEFPLGDD